MAAAKLVLPVEDERIVARDLQGRLTRLGYAVPAIASSKQEALQLVESVRPDVVLMDVTLNGHPEGISAAQEIRERFDLPVIYLTAHSDSNTLEQAKETEPFGYILKPFEDRELMVAVETAIHKHGAERRLRQTERWLAATLSSIGDAVITLDDRLQVTFLNRIAEELTGWKTAEAAGTDLFSVFSLADKATEGATRELIATALSQRVPYAWKDAFTLIDRSRNTISVSGNIAPILDDHGRSDGIVLSFRDVTESERAQREIRERGDQQAAANRVAQRALAGLDSQSLLDYGCEIVSRILQVDVCEFLEVVEDGSELKRRSLAAHDPGAAENSFSLISSRQARHVLKASTPAILSGDEAPDPLTARHHAVSAAAVVLRIAERPHGILAAYSRKKHPFTLHQLEFLQSVAYTLSSALERTLMEKRLRETEQMHSIGVLAGGIAHDFNNLLAVIMGQADEARRECQDCEAMCQILAAADHASYLTRQLLAYAGKGHYVSKLLNLSGVVSQSAADLRRSVPKGVELDIALAENLPLVEADPNQVRLILLNLVANAVEAVQPNSGCIRVRTRSFELGHEMFSEESALYKAVPGKYVELEVADNGCGIDPATKGRIFEPFFTTKFTGRGLGLASVQGIVRAYRGFVQVVSSPGFGSTFRIFLPASAKPPLARAPRATQPPVPRSEKTVLVIEDEPLVRKMLGTMLMRLGFQVLEAENGIQALEVLDQAAAEPAAVLLDLVMPVMGAAELLPVLSSRCPELKIIATSGYSEDETRALLQSSQIAGFLQKPYKRDELSAVLRRVLG